MLVHHRKIHVGPAAKVLEQRLDHITLTDHLRRRVEGIGYPQPGEHVPVRAMLQMLTSPPEPAAVE